ncbi:MAG: sigma-54 dependent transcriptional regulator [Candidatus Marinimicrobia bacterium]|nr:sigma-54 dependent transcriptional regulator [Candidatus Neomarinimicrobiota bacterium]
MKILLCTHKANQNLDFSWLAEHGEIVPAKNWTSALQFLAIEKFDVLFMDTQSVKGDYALFQHRIEKLKNHTPQVFLTTDLALDQEFLHIYPNVFGFYFHPEDDHSGKEWIQRVKSFKKLVEELSKPSRDLLTPAGLGTFIGNHPEMLKQYRLLMKAIPSDITILITGPSGSGKEVAAKNIHQLGPRANSRFVSINCAAIPDNLLESELFGYEPGAFTGAQKSKPGKVELANGGTLLLDEIGDMPTELQNKLLRVLEEQEVERLGGTRTVKIDVRILAATHQNLLRLVEEGRFRADLYYRLNVVPAKLPPLSSRRSDIQLLVLNFLDNLVKSQQTAVQGIQVEAVEAIQDLPFPGQVRELENIMTRLVFMSEGRRITPKDVAVVSKLAENAGSASVRHVAHVDSVKPLWQVEKDAIEVAMLVLDGNISQVAQTLEISRNALYRKIKVYEIDMETLKNDG